MPSEPFFAILTVFSLLNRSFRAFHIEPAIRFPSNRSNSACFLASLPWTVSLFSSNLSNHKLISLPPAAAACRPANDVVGHMSSASLPCHGCLPFRPSRSIDKFPFFSSILTPSFSIVLRPVSLYFLF